MVVPFMLAFLIFVPPVISYIALIGLLIAGIVELRQGYIGRPAIAGNALLLWQIFFSSFSTLPEFFQWYLNIGTIIAILALMAYFFRLMLPTRVYQLCFIFYGSLSVIMAVMISVFNIIK